jgi:hypothetical protein
VLHSTLAEHTCTEGCRARTGEVGFNAGHSALFWLQMSDAAVQEFDLGNLPYACALAEP